MPSAALHPLRPAGAVRSVIEGYTAEAGVRSLSRCLAAVCRHVAVQVVHRQEQEGEQQGGLGMAPGLGGGAGRGHQPPPLPQPAFHGAAGGPAGTAAAAAADQHSTFPAGAQAMAPLSSSAALQLHQPEALTPLARVRLWAQLLPLATIGPAPEGPSPAPEGPVSAAGAAVYHAVSGYPWRQLLQPLHSKSGTSRTAGSAAAAPVHATDCACASRKQASGWFGWLRWARQDSHAEQAGTTEISAGTCACAGGCDDADCCCNASPRRRQLGSGPAADWGEHGEAGTAADSASWEASWRSAAQHSVARARGAAEAAPILCGPGSMQVLRSPGRGDAHRWAALPGAAGAGLQQQRGLQLAQGEGLPNEEVPEGLLVAEALLPPSEGPQQQQQQIVVDAALIETVLGPRRYEGHNSAGGLGRGLWQPFSVCNCAANACAHAPPSLTQTIKKLCPSCAYLLLPPLGSRAPAPPAERVSAPGTAAGLVWTAVGGKVQYIECICVGAGRAGRPGQLTLTGGQLAALRG